MKSIGRVGESEILIRATKVGSKLAEYMNRAQVSASDSIVKERLFGHK